MATSNALTTLATVLETCVPGASDTCWPRNSEAVSFGGATSASTRRSISPSAQGDSPASAGAALASASSMGWSP
jgi:hypothetical protein